MGNAGVVFVHPSASWPAIHLLVTDWSWKKYEFQTINFGFFWKTNGCSLFFHANMLHVSYDHVFCLPTLDERWLHWWWNVGEVEHWTLAHLGSLFSSRGQNQWCLVTPKQDALEDWRRHKSDRHMALAFEWMVETVHGGLELWILTKKSKFYPYTQTGHSYFNSLHITFQNYNFTYAKTASKKTALL